MGRHVQRCVWVVLGLLAGCGGQSKKSESLPVTPGTTEPVAAPVAARGKARITVTCGFSQGWAAVFPKGTVDPQRDEYAMQALIGLTTDPDFWKNESDYADLAPWAAERCDGGGGATFEVPPGELTILVGRAESYDAQAGGYQNNGAVREITAHAGDDDRQTFEQSDLVLDFPCISCPWLEVWDPVTQTWDRRVEILVDLYSAKRARAQRRAIGTVTVTAGLVRLRIAEDDDEISYLSGLTLELAGQRFPAALGGTITLRKGARQETLFVTGLADGVYPAFVVATGYYEPIGALKRR